MFERRSAHRGDEGGTRPADAPHTPTPLLHHDLWDSGGPQPTDVPDGPHLVAHHHREDDQLRIEVIGDLTVDTEDLLVAAVVPYAAFGVRTVELDLAGVDFCDSNGLRSLIAAQDGVEQAGARLVVVEPAPMVAQLLELTSLGESFGVAG